MTKINHQLSQRYYLTPSAAVILATTFQTKNFLRAQLTKEIPCARSLDWPSTKACYWFGRPIHFPYDSSSVSTANVLHFAPAFYPMTVSMNR